jgi:hypothetical protein
MESLRAALPGCHRPSSGTRNPSPGDPGLEPRGRLRQTCLALLLALACVPSQQAAESDIHPGLLRSLRQLESAFRHADVRSLVGVLPRESKVLVGLETFSQPKAYYAPDQVVLIFRKVFNNVRVVSFHLEPDGLKPRSELLYVPATWSVRRSSSGTKDIRLQFTLRKEGDAYYVRGIQEVN